MSRVRFATARALFETFPQAHFRISVPPTDDFSLAFLRALVAQGKLGDATAFCAYLLGRREVVWWGCRSVRQLLGTVPAQEVEALNAAEAWVREPERELRQAAQEVGDRANPDDGATWLARAAGWTSGVIIPVPGTTPIAPPPELTPHAVCLAIALSSRHLAPDLKESRLKACIEDGAKLAESEL